MRKLILTALFAVCVARPIHSQPDFPERTRQQIAELLAEKESRSPAQRKLGSNLIYAARMARGQRLTPSVARLPLATAALRMRRQLVNVDIEGEITPELQQAIQAAGGEVGSAFPEYHTLRAWIPLQACERLAERDDVGSIVPAAVAWTTGQVTRELRKAVTRKRALQQPLALLSPPVHTTVDLGGVVGHGADLVHALGYDGSGVKIAAMSDGIDSLSSLVNSGHLPANIIVVPGQAGTGDEGTALLNVLYDMAPGAQLFYAQGGDDYPRGSAAQMAANIRTLVDTYHVDIIVDDIQWSSEGFFQDTDVSKAVTYAANHGVLYVSAAGNDNNLDSGTAGTWLGDFADGGTVTLGSGSYQVHSFGTSNGQPVIGNLLGPQPGGTELGTWTILQWANPWNCATDDYDLFLIDQDDQSVAGSGADYQYCSRYSHPYEKLPVQAAGYQLYISRKSDSARVALQLITGRGMLRWATNGVVWGHGASKDALTVAATNVQYTNGEVGGGAPFRGGAHNPIDIISSDGPRAMFFDPDGNPLNPNAANPRTFAGGGATLLPKVDITAADAVHTAVPDYDPFGGTSAAAPHAAAIAALIKSADPYITNASVIAIMKATALRVTTNQDQPDGVAYETQGAGIAMANRAIAALTPTITIASSPSGQAFSVSGAGCNPGSYTTPALLRMTVDAVCSITLSSTSVSGNAGTRYAFANWSDGPTSNPRSLTVPVAATTFTANFLPQYQLTVTPTPANGGTITVSPESASGYYDPAAMVQLTALPADGFSFTGWSGDAEGTANPIFVTMGAVRSVTAAFTHSTLSSVGIAMFSQSETPGRTLEIPIFLAGTGPVYPTSFQFDLSFDRQLLAFNSARAGSALTNSGKSLATQTLGNGDVRFQSAGAAQASIGNGPLAYARLTLAAQFTGGSTAIALMSCSSTDGQGNVLSTACSAALVVSGWCDLNGDHVSDSSDVVALAAQLLNPLLPGRDLTRDGVLNVIDAQKAVNAAMGQGCSY